MFTKISFALRMLLGSAWAVLAQNYVNQMAQRVRHPGSVISPFGLLEGRGSRPSEQFRICVMDRRPGPHPPPARLAVGDASNCRNFGVR